VLLKSDEPNEEDVDHLGFYGYAKTIPKTYNKHLKTNILYISMNNNYTPKKANKHIRNHSKTASKHVRHPSGRCCVELISAALCCC
jgi:hypothetical protein